MRFLAVFAGLLILGGGSLLVGASYLLRSGEWVPVSAPIELVEGRSFAFDLKARSDGSYEIAIDVEKTLPQKEIECLLGLKPLRGTCGGIQPELSLSWRVAVDRNVTVSGDTSSGDLGASYGPTIARKIGRFPSVEGTSYQIRLDVLRTAPELAATNPQLRITRDAMEYKSAFVQASILSYLALAILALGAILAAGMGLRMGLRSWRSRERA
ncbi:MAG: hypothetical protein QNJ30_10125 [Kiloniellales bacterium]|nr:hypothetical protein [Kiloniellales bacterium]